MNPVTPMPAMSRGGTFMRPGAMAWSHGAYGDSGAQDPVTPAAIEDALAAAVTLDDPGSELAHLDVVSAIERAVQHGPAREFPIDVTFPGEGEPFYFRA